MSFNLTLIWISYKEHRVGGRLDGSVSCAPDPCVWLRSWSQSPAIESSFTPCSAGSLLEILFLCPSYAQINLWRGQSWVLFFNPLYQSFFFGGGILVSLIFNITSEMVQLCHFFKCVLCLLSLCFLSCLPVGHLNIFFFFSLYLIIVLMNVSLAVLKIFF